MPAIPIKVPQALGLRMSLNGVSGGVGFCIRILNDIHVIHDTVDTGRDHIVRISVHGALRGGGGAGRCNGLAGVVGTHADEEGEEGRCESTDDVRTSGTGKEGTRSEDHAGNHETIGKLVPVGACLGHVLNIARENLEAVLPHAGGANREADHHGHGWVCDAGFSF